MGIYQDADLVRPSRRTAHAVWLAGKFCRDHLADPISVEDMAAAAGLTRFHFSRIFKQATGRTPHQYLLILRLRRAAELLGQSGVSVSAVARQTGFSDPSHFCNVFKRAMGMTPTAFRQSGLY